MFRNMLPRVLNVFSGVVSKVAVTQAPLCLTRCAAINSRALSSFSFSSEKDGPILKTLKNYELVPVRAITKYSVKTGKRKSEKRVLQKFYRLDWGMWIHGKCGRQKKLYKKSPALRNKLKRHVFSNASQSWLLDKMVTKFWRKPKYYVDDPYEPYHRREEFPYTRKAPVQIE